MPFRGRPGSNKGGSLEDMFRYIDATVGRLVDALEAAGLRDNTLIIFTADNGDSKHGMKMHATEDGPRVPLIINGPNWVKALGSTGELVEFSDIFPTLMDYSGASLPTGYALDGKSLRPFLTGAKASHRESILSYIATARMARTKDWMLEAVDPVYGSAEGRLYRTKGGHRRADYVLVGKATSAEERAANTQLLLILEKNPWPNRSDPKVAEEIRSYDRMPYKHFLDTGKLVQKIYTH